MPDYRIIVLGCGGAGKSTITMRYVNGIFIEDYDPNIESSYKKSINLDSQQDMLDILDTTGAAQFTAMRDLYFKVGHGFLLLYSITAQSTFNEIPDLCEQIIRIKDRDKVPMVLVGNKRDLQDERAVTKERGEILARKLGCAFYETSAKTNNNVEQVFEDLIRQIRRDIEENPPETDKNRSAKEGNCSLL